jgi:hypothetical protein
VVKVGGEEHEHGGADRGVLKYIHNVGSVLKSEIGTYVKLLIFNNCTILTVKF